MSDSTAARQFLAQFLATQREQVVDAATDWVIAQAKDLRGQRPRNETRQLVAGVVDFNAQLILHGDEAPLHRFIDHVTTLRASSEFFISTLLRGFGSFRSAMAELLASPAIEATLAYGCLRLIDDSYASSIFQMSDEYVRKLNQIIVERRQQLEAELAEVAEQRRREYDEAMAVIASQRLLLQSVSLPILQVWKGILVVPIIGELSARRTIDLLEQLLTAVVERRARFVILDVTGLSMVDAAAASGLVKAMRATKLLGAAGMLVGISPAIARELGRQHPGELAAPTFATLADGLAAALKQQGTARGRSPA